MPAEGCPADARPPRPSPSGEPGHPILALSTNESTLARSLAPPDSTPELTSTPAGDLPELKAVAEVLGEHVYNVNISSTKSMTGHLLGAAGAVEALACIFAMTHGVVPPTINCQTLDPAIDPKLNLTLNEAQKREVKCALSNTFGFGGHNSTVIFRKL